MRDVRGALPTNEPRRTIARMPVKVDPSLAIRPLTVADVHAMLRVGIIGPDARVELLDGVLADMSPQGKGPRLCRHPPADRTGGACRSHRTARARRPGTALHRYQDLIVRLRPGLDGGDARRRLEPRRVLGSIRTLADAGRVVSVGPESAATGDELSPVGGHGSRRRPPAGGQTTPRRRRSGTRRRQAAG